jgi:hypothetical protein
MALVGVSPTFMWINIVVTECSSVVDVMPPPSCKEGTPFVLIPCIPRLIPQLLVRGKRRAQNGLRDACMV